MPDEQVLEVHVEDLGSLSLAGFIIREMINRNLQKPGMAGRVGRMNVVMEIRVSRMVHTLRVQNGEVSLRNGTATDVQVRVRGSMNDFLTLCLFKIPWEGLLKGRLWASGRIYKLPGVMPLLLI